MAREAYPFSARQKIAFPESAVHQSVRTIITSLVMSFLDDLGRAAANTQDILDQYELDRQQVAQLMGDMLAASGTMPDLSGLNQLPRRLLQVPETVARAGGEGVSLTNKPENYCAAAWCTFLSKESRPPLRLKRMLLERLKLLDYRLGVLNPVDDAFCQAAGMCGPALIAGETRELVGARINPGRGERFAAPPETPPTQVLRHQAGGYPRISNCRDDCLIAAETQVDRTHRQLQGFGRHLGERDSGTRRYWAGQIGTGIGRARIIVG